QPIAFDVGAMGGVDPGFEDVVEEGQVRDDLFRRVSVIRIDMPPLRNRREDIPAIANYYLRDTCAALNVAPKTFSRGALALVAALPWRGNGPELQSLLSAVVAGTADASAIGMEDVLAHVRLDGASAMI